MESSQIYGSALIKFDLLLYLVRKILPTPSLGWRSGVGIRPGRIAVGTWGLLPAGKPQPSRMGFELLVNILWPMPQKKTEQTSGNQNRGSYSLWASLASCPVTCKPLLAHGGNGSDLSVFIIPRPALCCSLGHPLCHPPQESRTGLPALSASHKPVAFLHGFSS